MATNFYDGDNKALQDENGNFVLARGSSVPSDGSSGYAVGCIFLDTDGGDDASLFINEGSTTSSDFNALGAIIPTSVDVTPTIAGASITSTSRFVNIKSTASRSVNDIVILPAPVVGKEITITGIEGTSVGYELRTSNVATISINNGSGAANVESAIPWNSVVIATCDSSTNWRAIQVSSGGTTTGVEVPA